MTTWRVALAESARRVGDPMEARRIVEYVLAETGAGSPAQRLLSDTMPAGSEARLDDLVTRRAGGEPLQHVLGGWGFRHLDVLVDGRALVPRPETEQLTQHALTQLDRISDERPGRPLLAADLGTGSGVVALSLAAERDGVEVFAVDKSSTALALAADNLARQEQPVAARVRLLEGDWFSGLPPDLAGELAVVVSNPPYLAADEWYGLDPVVRDYDPYEALVAGPTGLEASATLVRTAALWLQPGGALVVEVAPHQRDAVLDLVAGCGLAYSEAHVERDLAGRYRVLVARTPESRRVQL
ncbi:MAG: peptide chain release factor N(5)-glutamine methyltransferase [Acidimicrobiales bacterium]